MKFSLALMSLGLCIAPAVAETIAQVPTFLVSQKEKRRLTQSDNHNLWEWLLDRDSCVRRLLYPLPEYVILSLYSASRHSYWLIKATFPFWRLKSKGPLLTSSAPCTGMSYYKPSIVEGSKLTHRSEVGCAGVQTSLPNGYYRFDSKFYSGSFKCQDLGVQPKEL